MPTDSNSDENTYPAGHAPSGLKRVFEQWGGKFIIIFSLLHISHDMIPGLLAPLLPFIREDLGLNYLQAGLVASISPFTSGLFHFLAGWLSDRIGRRKAIALGFSGVGLCCVAMLFAGSYYALLAVLVALGMISSFYHPSIAAVLSTQYEESRRGKAMALHDIGGRIGFVLSPLLGALIASRLNWHYAYAIIGIPALVAAIFVFTRLKLPLDSNKHLSPVPAPAATPGRGGLLRTFRAVGIIMVISLAMSLLSGPIMSFMPLLLVDVHHLSPEASSIWITVVRIGSMVGSLCGGWLSDKLGRLRVIFIAMILQGAVTSALAQPPSEAVLYLSCTLFGVLLSMREITMQTYLMDNSPPHLRATVFGIYFGFGQEGSSIIQPFAGNFMDTLGISKVYRFISWLQAGLSTLTLTYATTTTVKRKKTKDIS